MNTPEIIEEIIRLRSANRRGALATVIETRGSTPVRAGAKMLVSEGGETGSVVLGSVGGGCLEAEVYQLAQRVSREGRPEVLQFTLTEDVLEKEGYMCGGSLEIFIEPI